MTQQPGVIRRGRSVGKSTSLAKSLPRFSKKLVDVNGDPLEIPEPTQQHLVEFYAWEVVGTCIPPVVAAEG